MNIDLSVFKNIDFINTDNLIFLSVLLVVTIIGIWVLFLILDKIVRTFRRMIVVAFNMDVAKPKFDKKNSTEWLHQQKNNNILKMKVLGGSSFGNSSVKEKKVKEVGTIKVQEQKRKEKILEGLSRLKSSRVGEDETLESKMPSRMGGYERIKIKR